MELKKASLDDHLSMIDLYVKRSSSDLKKIKAFWAVGDHAGKLMVYDLHQSVGKYNVVWLDVKELVGVCDFGEVDILQLFNDKPLNNFRVAQILNRWNNGKFVDPPTLYLDRYKNKIAFSDGRHRTKTAYFLGHKTIPIALDIDDLAEIQELISFKSIE